MKKYKYIYEIRTNNLCWGNKLLATCGSFQEAKNKYFHIKRQDKYGCIDICKKRQYLKYLI